MSETTESTVEGSRGSLRAAVAGLGTFVRTRRSWWESVGALARWLQGNPKRSFLAGAGLVALAVGVHDLVSSRSSAGALVAAAIEGPFEVKIVESGTLQALRSVNYSSAIPGSQAKIIYLVPEGTNAHVGDALVKFDAQPFVEQLEQTKAQLAQAEAELVKAEQELKLLRIATREEVTEARDKVRLSELELKSVTEGKGKLAEAESAAKLSQARRELEKAVSNYDDLKPLLDEGFITKLELDRASQAVEKAREDLELTEIRHSTYIDYTRPTEVEGSRSAFNNSKESLRQAERANSYRLSQAEAALRLARSKEAELTAKLQQQSQSLAQCEIRATVAGLVIYKDVFFGSEKRKVQVGDQVWPNQPLIMLPDLSQMVVDTQVRETDIYKVQKDQEVLISVDAYPELELTGKVNYIGTLAQTDRARHGGKYFTVTILTDDADPRLRPGMTTRVELLVERLDKATYVALEAVFERGGRNYVYVVRNGSTELQEVLVGPSNENHIVVEAGVTVGDWVLLGDPNEEGRPLGGEELPGFLDVVAPASHASEPNP